MNFNNKILLAKIQATTNVDPTPTGSDVVVAEDLNWNYYEGDTITRNRDKPYLGADEEITASPYVSFDFSIELSQANAAGTVPAYDTLLQICGMASVNAPGVDTTYTPISTGFKEAAFYFVDDQEQEQKSLNCKGSFGFEITAKQLPRFKFASFNGTYATPTAVGAAYVVSTTAWEDAVPASKDNTSALTIDGYQGCVESITFDMNNTVVYKDKPGCKSTNITDRDPGGTIVVKAPTLADKNFFTMMESHINVTKYPVVITHGDGTRPSLTINLPLVQFTGISRTDVDGEVFYTLPYKAIASDAGNDEIEIII